MRVSSYGELLKDPRWQRKRLQVFQRDGWKCTRCSRKYLELVLHHKIYYRGKYPWDYHNDDLTTVCEPCHRYIHNYEPKKEIGLEHISVGIKSAFGNIKSDFWKTMAIAEHERSINEQKNI